MIPLLEGFWDLFGGDIMNSSSSEEGTSIEDYFWHTCGVFLVGEVSHLGGFLVQNLTYFPLVLCGLDSCTLVGEGFLKLLSSFLNYCWHEGSLHG